MDTNKFYSDKYRLKYNPSKNVDSRKGARKLISYDDRFDEVVKELSNLIDNHEGKVNMLDIGIGDGVYEKLMPKDLRDKAYITAVDISEKQLRRSKSVIDKGVAIDLDSSDLPFADNKFDLVIISELLEHVFNPDKVLRETIRVLKPGGYLLLTYPNAGAIQLRLALLLTGNSPLLNFPENKEHIRFFGHKDIRKMTKSVKEIKYIGLGSFLVQRFNFPYKIITPRCIQVIGNKYMRSFALGHLLVLQK